MSKEKLSFGKFSTDPYLFLNYYRINFYIFLIVDTVLILLKFDHIFSPFTISPIDLFIFLFAFFFAGLSAVFIHNAVHLNFRPRWLNRLVGEIMGVHQLYGFLGWQTAHLIHHKYPDNPQFDPHPPGNQNFLEFAMSMQKNLKMCLSRIYFSTWTENEKFQKIWKKKNFFAALGMLLKLIFWFLILEPKFFLIWFVPSYLLNVLFFAHFNFSTHRPSNGETVILNLDQGWYFKLINLLLFGIYYHRNHHLRASLFNPKKYTDTASKLGSTRS